MSDPRPFARSSISSVGAEAVLAALPALSRRGGRSSIRVFTEEEARAELAAPNRAGARLVAMGGRSLPWSAPATARRSDRNSRQLANELGLEGFVTASGFARGIDTAAHLAALERGTIA